MFVISNLLFALAEVVRILLNAYMWVIIIRALLSWVSPDPYNPIVRFIRSVTEPVFYRVRRVLPFLVVSGIDLSPIVILLGVEVLRTIVVTSLYELASRLAAAATGFLVG